MLIETFKPEHHTFVAGGGVVEIEHPNGAVEERMPHFLTLKIPYDQALRYARELLDALDAGQRNPKQKKQPITLSFRGQLTEGWSV